MLSSPTLNIIVISMVVSAFPLPYVLVQYGLLAILLLGLVPLIAYLMNRRKGSSAEPESPVCAPTVDLSLREKTIWQAAREVVRRYVVNIWQLFRFAAPMMLVAAAIGSVLVELIPFERIFADVTFAGLLLTALVTVFLPVPIALDVMVAHQLYNQGVAAQYVMLFLFALGTYSILPMIYLWQEVSRKLAIGLYAMFVALGIVAAYAIGLFL